MLYIMRHGETDWNAQHKLQGKVDIALNSHGIEMAENAAKRYADVHFDVCFCSPLTRAKQTAQILLKGRHVPIYYDDRLMEMSFGKWEGVSGSFPAKSGPMSVFFSDPENYIPPEGAESFDELFARTGEFYSQKVKPLLLQNKDVLIVGHGAMNSSIICRVLGIPLKDFWSAGIESCKLIKVK